MTRVTMVAFDGFDLLDTGGPYEVLLTAGRLLARDGRPADLTVELAALQAGPVPTYGGMVLMADVALAQVDSTDVLIVPGAVDTETLVGDTELIAQIGRLATSAQITLSVCTGAFLLAAAGLLEGREWTTHHEDVDALAELLGAEGAQRDVRWVDSGDIVTGAGLSSGIAAALHVVERLYGRALAERTAEQIEYTWER